MIKRNLTLLGAYLLLGGALSLPPGNAEAASSGKNKSAPTGVQSIDPYVDGEAIHLLTVTYKEREENPVIEYRPVSSKNGELGKPVRLGEGQPPVAYANRGNDIHMVAKGENLFALWTTKGDGPMGSGPLVAALSSDGGKTWRPAMGPADDGTTCGHRFTDLAADEKGVFHAVWLDNRTGTQALYYSRSADFGKTWSKNRVLDGKTCECCWNRIALGRSGEIYVLYRDKDPRDMALAFSSNNGETWETRPGIGRFDWEFNGCPHVGGGLTVHSTSSDSSVHALVWTGKDGSIGLYHVSSQDQGRSFGKPHALGGETAKYADIATNNDGTILASWAAYDKKGWSVYISRSENGVGWDSPKRLSDRNTQATHPRIVSVTDQFFVFWTQWRESGPSEIAVRLLR